MPEQKTLEQQLQAANKKVAVMGHLLTQLKVSPEVIQSSESLFGDFTPVMFNDQIVNFNPNDHQTNMMRTMLAQGAQQQTQPAAQTVQATQQQQQKTQQPVTVEQMMPMMMMAMMQKMMGGDADPKQAVKSGADIPGGIKPNGAVGGALTRETIASMSQSDIASNWDAISAAMTSGALNAT